MRYVAHRGLWRTPEEKNRRIAFERALEQGFGIETDVRDATGRLVISHDMPSGAEMGFDEFIELCGRFPEARPIAINIKADGMQAPLRQRLDRAGLAGYFVFDMSVPDALAYVRQGTPAFTRLSEHEPSAAFMERAAGVWLDAFESTWYGAETIRAILDSGKAVCVVSPELHERDPGALWRMLLDSGLSRSASLSLCTDHPDRAREYFRG